METHTEDHIVRAFGTNVTNVPIPRQVARMKQPVLISIEAAIGTGKSSLLKVLQSRLPSWVVVQEPVDMWQNIEGHNLLGAFYENLERYAFSFQTYCVLSRIEVVVKALEHCSDDAPVIILERSWFSDRHTFAEMLHKTGKINSMEWALYERWYDFAVRNSPRIHGHVYLDCKVNTCMNRLRKRSRSEEVGVTEEYQDALIQHHEEWLNSLDQRRVCRIRVDDDFLGNEKFCKDIVHRVSDFVDDVRHV